jgi:hypothetical protein
MREKPHSSPPPNRKCYDGLTGEDMAKTTGVVAKARTSCEACLLCVAQSGLAVEARPQLIAVSHVAHN